MTSEEFKELLINKIDDISMDNIKQDIVRFIPDDKDLEIWSEKYFRELVGRIRFTE